jgi:hypothetical protein
MGVVFFTPWRLYPWERTLVHTEQEVGGPQNQFTCFREEKNLRTAKSNGRNESVAIHSLLINASKTVYSTCICNLEQHANKNNNHSSMVKQQHASCPHN